MQTTESHSNDAAAHPGRIRITVDQAEGQSPLTITIDPGNSTPTVTTSSTPAAAIVAPPTDEPTKAVVANNQPALSADLTQLAQGETPAARELACTTGIYESLEHNMREAFSKELQSIDKDVFQRILHEVNKVMQQLLQGSELLHVPTDEINAVKKELVAAAQLTFKNKGPESFCAHTLQTAIHKNPVIENFTKKHKDKKAKTEHKHAAHGGVGDHEDHKHHESGKVLAKLHHEGTVQDAPEHEKHQGA